MRKLLKMGLIGLVLGAGAAVATATVGSSDAAAGWCCMQCEPVLDQCKTNCGMGPDYPQCRDQCEIEYGWCMQSCFPC